MRKLTIPILASRWGYCNFQSKFNIYIPVIRYCYSAILVWRIGGQIEIESFEYIFAFAKPTIQLRIAIDGTFRVGRYVNILVGYVWLRSIEPWTDLRNYLFAIVRIEEMDTFHIYLEKKIFKRNYTGDFYFFRNLISKAINSFCNS